jgi:hypothetical protein
MSDWSLSDSHSSIGRSQAASIIFPVIVVAALFSSPAQAEPVVALPPRNADGPGMMTNARIEPSDPRDQWSAQLKQRTAAAAAATTVQLSKRQSVLGGTSDAALTSAAPSTSVALIILYSITGIITALFLLIIITGAVRAHRHPERYGPRATARFGRPRQSRAKGLARAVLDTIPIVRFGTPSVPEVEKPTDDVEMQEGNTTPEPHPPPPTANAEAVTQGSVVAAEAPAAEEVEAESSDAVTNPDTTAAANTAEEALSSQQQCPVCMEDFEQGQEVRILPCHHHFHPDCIDPWLLNVSGSCPLWCVPPRVVPHCRPARTYVYANAGIAGSTSIPKRKRTEKANREPAKQGLAKQRGPPAESQPTHNPCPGTTIVLEYPGTSISHGGPAEKSAWQPYASCAKRAGLETAKSATGEVEFPSWGYRDWDGRFRGDARSTGSNTTRSSRRLSAKTVASGNRDETSIERIHSFPVFF